jgi:Flp pilus assembly pilin Flp
LHPRSPRASPQQVTLGRSGSGMSHRGVGSELGATAVEYAVMLTGIAAIIMGTIFAVGVKTDGLFENLRVLWP